MGIEVGEYVRTDNGIIGKYVKYRGWQDSIETNNKWFGFDINKDIVKHSKDIIDLIEKNDYVNGCKVYIIEKDVITVYQEVEGHPVDYNYIMADEIKSIVTKEQIKQIEFRIKE